MTDSKTLAQRIVDAATMFAVSSICLLLLLFVGYGTVTRTYEQQVIDKLVAQGQLVQSSIEAYVRPGLPLSQYVGYQRLTQPMIKGDQYLDTMTVYHREGDVVFSAGDTKIRALPPTDERMLANEAATMRTSERLLQIVLPLRNKFERVGDLVLTASRKSITDRVNESFRWVIYLSMAASLVFAISVFATWGIPDSQRKKRVAVAFTTTYLSVAVALAITMVSVFSDGAQSKGRALADSLGQRLDDIIEFGLQLDQIDGLGEAVSEYRRLNPDINAAGVAVNGRVVVHTDPAQVGRYWLSDPSNHEYRADLTPANHPRATQVVVAVPKAIVYWQVLRSVKNFAALFVASGLFAFLFMQVAQSIQQARRESSGAGQDWRSIAALDLVKPIFFMAVFVDHLSYAFLPQFVSEIALREGMPANYVALPFMAYYFCFALALMPAGRFELRFGSRSLIVVGLVLSVASMVLLAAAGTFELVTLARVVAGIGQGMLFIGVQSYVLAKSAREHRTKANTIIVFGYQAGMISGMAIGSLLVGQISPGGVFMLGAVVGALITLYALGVLPSEQGAKQASPASHSSSEIWREIGLMLRDRKFCLAIFLIGIPAKAVLTGVILFAMPLLLHAKGFAQEDIGQVTMIYAACVIVASAYAAQLADQTANTRMILAWGALLTALGLVAVAASGWDVIANGPHAFVTTASLVVAGAAIVGIAHGFINAPVVTHVTETGVAGKVGATSVGAAYRFIERAGHTIGPIMMGQLILHFGASTITFAWAGLAVLVLGVLFFITSREEAPSRGSRQEFAR